MFYRTAFVGALAIFPAVAPALADETERMAWGGHHWGGHHWGGWFFGPVFMVLFLVLVIVLVVLLVRWLTDGQPRHRGHRRISDGRTPLDILEERFARGEIDGAEFEERRKLLRGDGAD